MIKAIRIYVAGRVQGVCYRASTQKQARLWQIEGWARNLDDGRVEIMAQAEDEALDQLVAWCHKGPMLAKVTSVSVESLPLADIPAGFVIL